ncbi:pentapeptide repeat-containing protein [Candidatus Saccharibacteria bacterium]|nr:pentapeptide repeat-containing protein [Candidatus Saccharibacteria bacterium]MCB9821509.1 pentapeptide repeat-containing protein [Candidatus Nomurabacteria bacterium]
MDNQLVDVIAKDYSLKSTHKFIEANIHYKKCSFVGVDLTESSYVRVKFSDCNFTGTNLAKVNLKQVEFYGCKIDTASFLQGTFKSVTFNNCIINDTLFCEASVLKLLRFADCELSKLDMRAMVVKDKIDFRDSTLSDIWGISSLKQVIISASQLTMISPVLALEAGISVTD